MGEATAAPSIEVLDPSHPDYDKADFTSNDLKSSDYYDSVLDCYNEAEVGDILFVPIPVTIRPNNVKPVLLNRGLTEGADIAITVTRTGPAGAPLPGEERRVKIKKLSDTYARILG